MGKRSLIELADGEPPDLRMLLNVAEKALDMGKVQEAERIVSSSVRHFQQFASCASRPDQLEAVAEMRAQLTPVVKRLEAATGKAWIHALDDPPEWKVWQLRRGQA